MDRSKFYHTITVRGTQELDFLNTNMSTFKMKYTPGYHRVTEAELGRFDLISFRMYGTHIYWWIICVANQIRNPFTDLEVGQILTIPSLLDIHDWYRRYKIR
jgi:hypothetical protein